MSSPRVRRMKKFLKLEKYEARMEAKAAKEAAMTHIEETFKPNDLDSKRQEENKKSEVGVELEVKVGQEPEDTTGMVEFDVVEGDEPTDKPAVKKTTTKKASTKKKTSKKVATKKNEE